MPGVESVMGGRRVSEYRENPQIARPPKLDEKATYKALDYDRAGQPRT